MHPFLKKTVIFFALAITGLYALHKVAFPEHDFFDQVASCVTYPFYCISGGVSDRYTHWKNDKLAYSFLKERYEALQKDYMGLLDEVITLQAQRHVYENVNELISFSQRYNLEHGITARVIFKHLDDSSHYILVNHGSSHGVKKDMVALYQNHVVGRVTDVYGWYSKVMLITDERSKVAAYTSKTQAPGIVQGFNNSSCCNFTYVSHLFQVTDNDLVISSGQGQVYPQGFCLGRIALHMIKDKELYYHIEIKPVVNFHGLRYVLLIDGANIKHF